MQGMNEGKKRRRGFFQFGTRGILALTAVIAVQICLARDPDYRVGLLIVWFFAGQMAVFAIMLAGLVLLASQKRKP